MCEISKSQRRTYRDQDPPRIINDNDSETNNGKNDFSPSSENISTTVFRKHQQHQQHQQQRWEEASISAKLAPNRVVDSTVSLKRDNNASIIRNDGLQKNPESCESIINGKEMSPVMGVPPPPPAPHMSPDGLILPRKPYNPCLISNNHKDLRKELLFNQKIGKSVLNQKSELQKALEKQREAVLRRETVKNREENYKDDPRTALQRALEQRARQIELMEHPPAAEPPNPLVTARAKLRTRTDSQ